MCVGGALCLSSSTDSRVRMVGWQSLFVSWKSSSLKIVGRNEVSFS